MFLAQVTKMQEIMSRRYVEYDKDIEACVSACCCKNAQFKFVPDM